jgi:hypothetical protein
LPRGGYIRSLMPRRALASETKLSFGRRNCTDKSKGDQASCCLTFRHIGSPPIARTSALLNRGFHSCDRCVRCI